MRRRSVVAAAVVASLTVAGAALAATYPTTAFDFAHPGTPHAALLSPASGDNDRPMLVIFGRFNDVGDTPNVDAASIATQFFGGGSAASPTSTGRARSGSCRLRRRPRRLAR